jgi:hypothetical protein
MSNIEELDQYEKNLEEKLEILKKCQQKHQVSSCMDCKKIIGCEIRKSYVEAVYLSMNKGKGGGFEF